MSPFEHTEDITSARPLVEGSDASTPPGPRPIGAVVTFRSVPGLTAESLQRVVNCHLARNAALGHVVPEMPNCPLVPNGVEARVSSASDGLAVSVTSNAPETAREILARVERLQPAPPSAAH